MRYPMPTTETVRFEGGPRDGETMVVPAPAPDVLTVVVDDPLVSILDADVDRSRQVDYRRHAVIPEDHTRARGRMSLYRLEQPMERLPFVHTVLPAVRLQAGGLLVACQGPTSVKLDADGHTVRCCDCDGPVVRTST